MNDIAFHIEETPAKRKRVISSEKTWRGFNFKLCTRQTCRDAYSAEYKYEHLLEPIWLPGQQRYGILLCTFKWLRSIF